MNRILIIGAGRSGVAAANFLATRGARVVINDMKVEADVALAGQLHGSVEKMFGSHPEDLPDGTAEVVLSPGVPRSMALVRLAEEKGIPVISEIELAYRFLKGRVIAITGSNGKSTTTTLIGEILKEAGRPVVVAGNIGAPLSAAIAEGERDYVVELSSFQLETVDTFRADVALLLNITPDHMDRYDSVDTYAEAKFRVFRNQRDSDLAIVNANDSLASTAPTRARVWKFSSTHPFEPGAWLEGLDLVIRADGEGRLPRSRLKVPGMANVENALAAWLAARGLGVPDAAVLRAFETFAGLPHRMALVMERAGVKWINDSKGTNVDATVKSLEGMEDGRVLLILGGKDKKGEFERLAPLVRTKVRKLLTIGSAAKKIEAALGNDTDVVPCRDMHGAVRYASEEARAGETVLLSPACASFDQYDNFEARGAHFEQLVRNERPTTND
jgi:UDP-N-acetylmuramoylalanine--D-glutamate ligase